MIKKIPFALKTQEQYDFVFQQLQRIQRALEDLRRDVEPLNKRNFEVMAEGYYDEIDGLMRELDTYKGPQIHRSPVGANQSFPKVVGRVEMPAAADK